jgi:hypothetical protein
MIVLFLFIHKAILRHLIAMKSESIVQPSHHDRQLDNRKEIHTIEDHLTVVLQVPLVSIEL